MKKSISALAILLFTINCFGTANFVYHERSLNNTGSTCGPYLSSLNPSYAEALSIEFVIRYQGFTNMAVIYYTTDGTNPSGSYGVPSGTTQVISAAYYCTFNNGSGVVDVAKGNIPALPAGTIVKYIVSAWNTDGGLEIFGSSGTNTTSASATVFSYVVSSTLPLNFINFSGKKANNAVALSWTTAQEINVDHYEVYHSTDGIQFKMIGTNNAVGNTSLISNYTATDYNPVNGNNFYKIKSVDVDGRYGYTSVIKIVFSEKANASIYQSGNTLQVLILSENKENYTMQLINNLGQIIKKDDLKSSDNKTEIQLPAGIMKGVYHVTLSSAHNSFNQSIFIQ